MREARSSKHFESFLRSFNIKHLETWVWKLSKNRSSKFERTPCFLWHVCRSQIATLVGLKLRRMCFVCKKHKPKASGTTAWTNQNNMHLEIQQQINSTCTKRGELPHIYYTFLVRDHKHTKAARRSKVSTSLRCKGCAKHQTCLDLPKGAFWRLT